MPFSNLLFDSETDKEYYPFTLFGDTNILKRLPGAETRIYTGNDEITFCDDYGVLNGTVIGILFPENYIPDIIKFKDKPYIPAGFAGQITSKPPGQIQILYNYQAKRCAIIFHIHENIVFGFKCVAKFVDDERYPRNESIIAEDLFDITITKEFLDVDVITNDDLKLVNTTLNEADLAELRQILNELLNLVKTGKKEDRKSLLNKASNFLLSGTTVASSLTTIADSYKTGGAAKKFIRRIIEYASL